MKNKIFLLALIILSLSIVACTPRETGGRREPAASKAVVSYTCPMHPRYISDKPGDCPICGMSLVLVTPSLSTDKKISGIMAVTIPLQRQKEIGLRTVVVGQRLLSRRIRAPGTVDSAGDGAQWVYASVPENDSVSISSGSVARVSFSVDGRQTYAGRVVAVAPAINGVSRSVAVRILITDTSATLTPGGYGTVEFIVPLGTHLAVPADAVIDTGSRCMVYVVTGNETFEARTIVATRSNDAWYTVVSGLSAGEAVVTNAAFLVDSESRLQAGLKDT
ncbi:MAG: heavy metal-binding domain-containing protein [Elusimicrobiota bacterium]